MLALLGFAAVFSLLAGDASSSAHGHSHSRLHTHAPSKRQLTQEPNWLPNYEFVVVGSGPGGGPVAARLAIAGHTVLLIDAGDDNGEDELQQVPALHIYATEAPNQEWSYFVNHYENATRQEKDSKMSWRTPEGAIHVGADPPKNSTPLGVWYPRAGTLGGCSAHNAMITWHAHESDWNNIAKITGDSSWSAIDMKKYFVKLEKNEYVPQPNINHGFKGWLTTSVTNLKLVVQDLKLLSIVIAAATAAGTGVISAALATVIGLGSVLTLDVNSGIKNMDQMLGVYQVPLAMTNGVRDGARGFILDTANAVNADGSRKYHLDIQLNTLVTKVRFDTGQALPTATGVDFVQGASLYSADPRHINGSSRTYGAVNATREVILSAGAFNTPQLLKLSGVGPSAELASFNIPVLVNLPGVGANLQDRYETTVVGKSNTDFDITKNCTWLRNGTASDPCYQTWLKNREQIDKGVYASSGLALGVIRKSSAASFKDDPDLLISGAPAQFTGYYPGYSRVTFEDSRHWAWIVLKAHTRNNAGTVRLRSTDPTDTPVINFRYFDEGTNDGSEAAKDLQAAYEGMEFARKIFSSIIPLQGTFEEAWPGKDVSTEAQMKEWIQNEAWGHHASCTAKIGADDDEMAVLDSKFRVRGTSGLRVVDASIFPKIPGFYISLPIYMASEKAAVVILEDAL